MWAVLALASVGPAAAQTTPAPPMTGHDHSQMAMAPAPLGLAANRNGSGTSWLPDDSPMSGSSRMVGPWHLMLHGNVFVQFLQGSGPRGDAQVGSINWFMGMAERPVAGGVFTARAMMSAEAFTTDRCGYPNLAQTGETCRGERLHDRQHPHDLFMEVAADYRRAINDSVAWQIYGGPVGEPALGPVAFPHRFSAMPNPIAPISHHWLDSTHITFGVVTGAVYGRAWKVEASAFNAQEPDDNRYDFDLAALSSYSGRASWLPSKHWAAQVSAGKLDDATRLTASMTYHRQMGGRLAAITGAWGQNREPHGVTNAWLGEAAVDVSDRDQVFLRGDITGKTAEELVVEGDGDDDSHDAVLTIAKLQIGYARRLGAWRGWTANVGASVGAVVVPKSIASAYDRRVPLELAVFFSVRP